MLAGMLEMGSPNTVADDWRRKMAYRSMSFSPAPSSLDLVQETVTFFGFPPSRFATTTGVPLETGGVPPGRGPGGDGGEALGSRRATPARSMRAAGSLKDATNTRYGGSAAAGLANAAASAGVQ